MNGQKVIKVFCHEEASKRDFDALNEQLFHDAENAHRFANIFGPIMNNIGNLLYVLTAFAGGMLITSGGIIPNLSVQNLVRTGSADDLGRRVVSRHVQAVHRQRLAGFPAV